MVNDFTYDVFLSHSKKDKAVVRAMAERLRRNGLRVWFDEWELRPGDSISEKIDAGLEHSRVLCMSAYAFGSDWAQLEAGTFRFRDPLNQERRFIPLRLDDAPIKGSLAQFLYINWLPQDRKQEYAKLREACQPTAKPTAVEVQGVCKQVVEKLIQLDYKDVTAIHYVYPTSWCLRRARSRKMWGAPLESSLERAVRRCSSSPASAARARSCGTCFVV